MSTIDSNSVNSTETNSQQISEINSKSTQNANNVADSKGIAGVADAVVNGLSSPDSVPQAIKNAVANIELPKLSDAQIEALLKTIKRKVKVDGEEFEVGITEMESDYQTKRASDKRFQEAARLRKGAEEVIHLLKTDPRAALRHPAINADERQLAEAILAEQLEQELMDPKDREIKELQRKLKQREETEAASKKAAEAQQLSLAEAQYVEQYQKDISHALTTAGLPITNATVRSMTGYLQNALEAGYDMEPSQVVNLVKEDYQKQIKELFSASDSQTIIALLGEDGLKKVRSVDLARLKTPVPPTPPPSGQGQSKAKEPVKKMKVNDFFAELKKNLKD